MSEGYPEFRLGQMIANLAFWTRGDQEGAVWNVEDEELIAAGGTGGVTRPRKMARRRVVLAACPPVLDTVATQREYAGR